MAYYNYYRQHNPAWGTNNYVFDSPPPPHYQPQPQWRGTDYYRAHNDGVADPSTFEYIWGRLKSRLSGTMSRRDAQNWHRRVYGGLTNIQTMLPVEIGAAAGYEAWRFFDHHNGIYRGPLMDDYERESEALVGLAVGEAEKLWAYTNRRGDKYGKREAMETAAAVATKLYRKGKDSSYSRETRYEQPYEQEPYLSPDSRYPDIRRQRRSSSASPYDGYSSGDYSDYDRRSDYDRSPPVAFGTPTVVPSGLAVSGSYGRRRAISSSYHTRPPIPSTYGVPIADSSALATSPGALILPPTSHHHSNSFGGYTSNGLPIQRIAYGDPTSQYGHLPPGTYMVTGSSSSRRKHRKSHSGGVRYVMG